MAQAAGMRVGEQVRALRERLRLTQQQVCLVWGRPQSNLSRIENDHRGVSHESLRDLVEAIHEADRLRALGILPTLRQQATEVPA
jgi:transcriptional regulator with XRE-family HTH domain